MSTASVHNAEYRSLKTDIKIQWKESKIYIHAKLMD